MGVGLHRGYQKMGLNFTSGKQDFHEAIDVSVPAALANRWVISSYTSSKKKTIQVVVILLICFHSLMDSVTKSSSKESMGKLERPWKGQTSGKSLLYFAFMFVLEKEENESVGRTFTWTTSFC